MYDPSAGRWLQEDPIRFEAGHANLYRYVHNAPTISRDPSGLEASPAGLPLFRVFQVFVQGIGDLLGVPPPTVPPPPAAPSEPTDVGGEYDGSGGADYGPGMDLNDVIWRIFRPDPWSKVVLYLDFIRPLDSRELRAARVPEMLGDE